MSEKRFAFSNFFTMDRKTYLIKVPVGSSCYKLTFSEFVRNIFYEALVFRSYYTLTI